MKHCFKNPKFEYRNPKNKSKIQISNAQNCNHEAHEEKTTEKTKNNSWVAFCLCYRLWTVDHRLPFLNFGHLNLFGI